MVEQSLLVLSLVLTVPGLFLNVLLVVGILRKQSLRTVANSFYVHMAFIDILLSLVLIVWSVLQGLSFAVFDRLGCQINGFLIQTVTGMGLTNLLSLAFYHYWVIVRLGETMSWSQVWKLIGWQWFQGIVLSLIPFWGSGYVVHPSGIWCGLKTESSHPIDMIAVWIDIFFMFLGPVGVGILYTCILAGLKNFSRQQKEIADSHHVSKSFANAKRILVYRAMLTTMSFVLEWIVLGTTWGYSAVFKTPISAHLDLISAMIVRANLVVNPLIYLTSDTRFRQSIFQIFGAQELSSFSDPGSYSLSKRARDELQVF
ncbi:hypothetical protein EDD86DRAFT_210621 [Gorgonomyces haynaldii]|nr:hypothetical protein EDD86DRAFT_210621 [Gorgonomyces haynaldii]